MLPFDMKWIRAQFPTLTQEVNHHPGIFFDGPSRTQVPGSEIICDRRLFSKF